MPASYFVGLAIAGLQFSNLWPIDGGSAKFRERLIATSLTSEIPIFRLHGGLTTMKRKKLLRQLCSSEKSSAVRESTANSEPDYGFR